MVKRKNIVELIQTLLSNYQDLIETQRQYKENMFQRKMAMAQKNLSHEKNLKQKNISLFLELKSYVEGSILDIRYLANKKECKARLTNMTEEEAKALLELYGQVHNLEIEILEIKKSPTFISEHLL